MRTMRWMTLLFFALVWRTAASAQAPAPPDNATPGAEVSAAKPSRDAPVPADARRIRLSRGTMQLGGSAAFRWNSLFEHGRKSDWSVSVSPEFGYLIRDRLALVFALGVEVSADDGHALTRFQARQRYPDEVEPMIQVGVGVKYLFDLGRAVPYLGVLAGTSLLVGTGEYGDRNTSYLDFWIPAGVLFPLNRHIALDLGLRSHVAVRLNHGSAVVFDLPVYFGVQAFL